MNKLETKLAELMVSAIGMEVAIVEAAKIANANKATIHARDSAKILQGKVVRLLVLSTKLKLGLNGD